MFDSNGFDFIDDNTDPSDDRYIPRVWADITIRQRKSDGYLSLTDMAQATATRLDHWLVAPKTLSYLAVLGASPAFRGTDIIQVAQGGIAADQGTWGHRRVAIRFAQHCDDAFAVEVDAWVEELFTTGSVTINDSPPTPAAEPMTKAITPPIVCGTTYLPRGQFRSADGNELATLIADRKTIERVYKGAENAVMRQRLLAHNDSQVNALLGHAPTPTAQVYYKADGTPFSDTERPRKNPLAALFKTRKEDFERIVADRQVISLPHIMALLVAAGCPTEETTARMNAFVRTLGYYPLPEKTALSGAQMTYNPVNGKDKTMGKVRFHSKVYPKTRANPLENKLGDMVLAHQFKTQNRYVVDARTIADAMNAMPDYFPMVVTPRYVSNTLQSWGYTQFLRPSGVAHARCWNVPADRVNSDAPEVVVTVRSRQYGEAANFDLSKYVAGDIVCSAHLHNAVLADDPSVSLRGAAQLLLKSGWIKHETRQSHATAPYGDYDSFTFYCRNQAVIDSLGDDGCGWDPLLMAVALDTAIDGIVNSRAVAHRWQQNGDRPFDANVRWATYNLKRLGFVVLRKSKTVGTIFQHPE